MFPFVLSIIVVIIIIIISLFLTFITYQVGNTILSHREPNPDEARIQAMSVIAACAKGLMYFQSEVGNTN